MVSEPYAKIYSISFLSLFIRLCLAVVWNLNGYFRQFKMLLFTCTLFKFIDSEAHWIDVVDVFRFHSVNLEMKNAKLWLNKHLFANSNMLCGAYSHFYILCTLFALHQVFVTQYTWLLSCNKNCLFRKNHYFGHLWNKVGKIEKRISEKIQNFVLLIGSGKKMKKNVT